MRLPQSLAQDLSLRSFKLAVISAAALFALLPTSLQARNQLSCWPTKLKFGNVAVGQTQSLLVTVTNNGQSGVTISGIDINNSQFSTSSSFPLTLNPGQGVDVSVTFAPNAAGWTTGKIAFVGAGGTLNLQVGGTGVTTQVTASPTAVSFGQVAVGSSATSPVMMTNTGSSSVSVSGLQTTGSGFSTSGPGFPLTLSAGASITLNVSFTPQTATTTTGNVLVSGPGLNVPLSGTGTTTTIGQLTLTPASLNFGNIEVGATSTLSTTLGASGGSVTVSSAASSNAQFALSGVSFPLTIATGQTVPVNIAFTPQSSGSVSGTVSFASSTTASTTTEALTGTGTTPYVVLSWNPSTSLVSGYNVYRCLSATCAYAKINSSLNATTTFTDASVVSGQSYYYVTTAVNSSGQESSYSNQIQVTIP